MKTKITWDELRTIIVEQLSSSRTIMTFGTIGSCRIDRDIDIIITKKPFARSDEFYKEIHILFDKLNEFTMKKYNIQTLRFARNEEEFVIRNLKRENEGAIFFHTMIYHSMSQLINDWIWVLAPDNSVEQMLRNNYAPLIGKTEMIFSKEFARKGYYDNLFNFLYAYDKVHSGYPQKMFLEVTRHNFNYLFKKMLGMEPPAINSIWDAKKAIYLFASIVDKLNRIILNF